MVEVPENVQKFYYPWEQFDADVEKIARAVEASGRNFKYVYGIPRGGWPLAVCLSHRMEIPIRAEDPFDPIINWGSRKQEHLETTFIVDDIADTGKQLKPLKDRGYFIATLFYHRQSTFIPDIWIHEKKKEWIVYPWEKEPR
ncbi:MAG: phosphoribosyltransferase [bacterium]|nr:phosphoribosyltransferase [bacterium]